MINFCYMILKPTFRLGGHIVNFAVARYVDGTEFVFKGCIKSILYFSLLKNIKGLLLLQIGF